MPRSCSDGFYFHVVYEYLVHMGMDATAHTMADECEAYCYPTPYLSESGVAMEEINQLLDLFDDENCSDFFKLFEVAVPLVTQNTTDCRKLKLGLHVYFAVSGLHFEKDSTQPSRRLSAISQSSHRNHGSYDDEGGENAQNSSGPGKNGGKGIYCSSSTNRKPYTHRRDSEDSDERRVMKTMCGKTPYYLKEYKPECSRRSAHPCMSVLLAFLEKDGSELSKEPELLPYFALPFILDPEAHPQYEHLFKPLWAANLRRWLWNFLIANRQAGRVPELVLLLPDRHMMPRSTSGGGANNQGPPYAEQDCGVCVTHITNTIHGKHSVGQYHPRDFSSSGPSCHREGDHQHDHSARMNKAYLRDCEAGRFDRRSKLTSRSVDERNDADKNGVTFRQAEERCRQNREREGSCEDGSKNARAEAAEVIGNLKSRYDQLHADYHDLLGVAVELTEAVEGTVRGEPVDLKKTLHHCSQFFPELVHDVEIPRGCDCANNTTRDTGNENSENATRKSANCTNVEKCSNSSVDKCQSEKVVCCAEKGRNPENISEASADKSNCSAEKSRNSVERKTYCDGKDYQDGKASVDRTSTGLGQRCSAANKSEERSADSAERRHSSLDKKRASVDWCENVREKNECISDNRPAVGERLYATAEFSDEASEKKWDIGEECRCNKDLIPHIEVIHTPRALVYHRGKQPAPATSIVQFCSSVEGPVEIDSKKPSIKEDGRCQRIKNDLDFQKIKCALTTDGVRKKLLLMQALRWRMTRSSEAIRTAAIEHFTENDVLDLTRPVTIKNGETDCLLENLLVPRQSVMPHPVQQAVARLVNTMASLPRGRDYLEDSPAVIRTIIYTLQDIEVDHITSEMLIATLRKLSTRKPQGEKMIESDLVEWLVDELANEEYNINWVKNSVALLRNLCAYKSARQRCIPIAEKALSSLVKLMSNDDTEALESLTAVLMCLLSNPDINQSAAAMGVHRSLKRASLLQNNSESRRRIEEILNFHYQQLNNQRSEQPSIHDEDIIVDDPLPAVLGNELDADDPVCPGPDELSGEPLLSQCYSRRRSNRSTGNVTFESLHSVESQPVDATATAETLPAAAIPAFPRSCSEMRFRNQSPSQQKLVAEPSQQRLCRSDEASRVCLAAPEAAEVFPCGSPVLGHEDSSQLEKVNEDASSGGTSLPSRALCRLPGVLGETKLGDDALSPHLAGIDRTDRHHLTLIAEPSRPIDTFSQLATPVSQAVSPALTASSGLKSPRLMSNLPCVQTTMSEERKHGRSPCLMKFVVAVEIPLEQQDQTGGESQRLVCTCRKISTRSCAHNSSPGLSPLLLRNTIDSQRDDRDFFVFDCVAAAADASAILIKDAIGQAVEPPLNHPAPEPGTHSEKPSTVPSNRASSPTGDLSSSAKLTPHGSREAADAASKSDGLPSTIPSESASIIAFASAPSKSDGMPSLITLDPADPSKPHVNRFKELGAKVMSSAATNSERADMMRTTLAARSRVSIGPSGKMEKKAVDHSMSRSIPTFVEGMDTTSLTSMKEPDSYSARGSYVGAGETHTGQSDVAPWTNTEMSTLVLPSEDCVVCKVESPVSFKTLETGSRLASMSPPVEITDVAPVSALVVPTKDADTVLSSSGACSNDTLDVDRAGSTGGVPVTKPEAAAAGGVDGSPSQSAQPLQTSARDVVEMKDTSSLKDAPAPESASVSMSDKAPKTDHHRALKRHSATAPRRSEGGAAIPNYQAFPRQTSAFTPIRFKGQASAPERAFVDNTLPTSINPSISSCRFKSCHSSPIKPVITSASEALSTLESQDASTDKPSVKLQGQRCEETPATPSVEATRTVKATDPAPSKDQSSAGVSDFAKITVAYSSQSPNVTPAKSPINDGVRAPQPPPVPSRSTSVNVTDPRLYRASLKTFSGEVPSTVIESVGTPASASTAKYDKAPDTAYHQIPNIPRFQTSGAAGIPSPVAAPLKIVGSSPLQTSQVSAGIKPVLIPASNVSSAKASDSAIDKANVIYFKIPNTDPVTPSTSPVKSPKLRSTWSPTTGPINFLEIQPSKGFTSCVSEAASMTSVEAAVSAYKRFRYTSFVKSSEEASNQGLDVPVIRPQSSPVADDRTVASPRTPVSNKPPCPAVKPRSMRGTEQHFAANHDHDGSPKLTEHFAYRSDIPPAKPANTIATYAAEFVPTKTRDDIQAAVSYPVFATSSVAALIKPPNRPSIKVTHISPPETPAISASNISTTSPFKAHDIASVTTAVIAPIRSSNQRPAEPAISSSIKVPRFGSYDFSNTVQTKAQNIAADRSPVNASLDPSDARPDVAPIVASMRIPRFNPNRPQDITFLRNAGPEGITCCAAPTVRFETSGAGNLTYLPIGPVNSQINQDYDTRPSPVYLRYSAANVPEFSSSRVPISSTLYGPNEVNAAYLTPDRPTSTPPIMNPNSSQTRTNTFTGQRSYERFKSPEAVHAQRHSCGPLRGSVAAAAVAAVRIGGACCLGSQEDTLSGSSNNFALHPTRVDSAIPQRGRPRSAAADTWDLGFLDDPTLSPVPRPTRLKSSSHLSAKSPDLSPARSSSARRSGLHSSPSVGALRPCLSTKHTLSVRYRDESRDLSPVSVSREFLSAADRDKYCVSASARPSSGSVRITVSCQTSGLKYEAPSLKRVKSEKTIFSWKPRMPRISRKSTPQSSRTHL